MMELSTFAIEGSYHTLVQIAYSLAHIGQV